MLTSIARSCRQWDAEQAGQVIVWVAVMLPLLLAVVGLSIDSGTVFDARRELQNVADSAARAGAMQIDQGVYRQSSGATIVLDPTAAQQAAEQYVADQGASVAASVDVGPRDVVVTVSRNVPVGFLRLAGISTIRVTATAPATARFGITSENG